MFVTYLTIIMLEFKDKSFNNTNTAIGSTLNHSLIKVIQMSVGMPYLYNISIASNKLQKVIARK